MKLKNLITTVCAALASFAFFAPAARATLPYSNGDLILGFRAKGAPGSTTNYEVNLGNIATYLNASGTVSPSVGDIKADLDTLYGAGWSTRGDVLWSVSSFASPAIASPVIANKTMFATREQDVVGTQSTPWSRPTILTAGAPVLKMTGMVSESFGYAAGTNTQAKQTESTNSQGFGLIQDSSGGSCYSSYQPGGGNTTGPTAFGYFSATSGNGIEGTFANGTAGTVLDFYKVEPGSGPSELLGTFTISDNAVITFTPANVAPAPGALAFSAATYTAPEVDAQSAPSVVPVTFSRTGGTLGAVTADLTVSAGGTLANGTDYVLADPTTVSFADGASAATVNIQLNAIAAASLPGTIVLGLSNPTGGATLGTTVSATVTINSVSANIHFTSATYSGSEAIAGAQIAVSITRDGNTSQAVSASFSTANGTAIAGTDYTAHTDTPVSFAAGQTTQTVLVVVADVAGFQGSRTFDVSLTNPSAGATVTAPATGTVTITDDDVVPDPAVLAFSAASFNFSPLNAQATPNNLVITLSRTGRLTGAVAVDVSIDGGSLENATDFTSPTTVNFADGATSATVQIQLHTIIATSLPGTINLTLSNPTGGANLGAQTTAVVNVSKLDLARPKVIATSPRAGASVTSSFTLTGKALDANGIDRVEVVLNGGAMQLATLGTFASGKITYTLAGLQPENGKNTLAITAVDTSGNRSTVLNVSLKYLNKRPEFAGGYNGLLVPAVTPTNNLSGSLNLTVTPTGTFTGSVLLGGFKVPVGGIFGNDGTAHFKPSFGTSLALVGKPGSVALGSLELSVATDLVLGAKVTGTLKSDPATVAANVSAPRNFFSGLNPVDTRYTLQNKGKFTVIFPAKAQGAIPTSDFPQGDGYANLTLTRSGIVKIVGKLADGTPFTTTAKLAGDYSWPFYVKLFAGQGSLAGLANFDDAQADSDLSGSNFLWFRPAQPTSKYYPAGWPAGLQIDLLGAKYILPVGASILPGLGATDPANGNATLVFSDGKLTGPLSKNVNIAPTNAVTNAPVTDKSFLLKVIKGTGQISGSFQHTDLTRPLFRGVILQKGANAGGYGYFLSKVTPGVTGESGGVSLEAK